MREEWPLEQDKQQQELKKAAQLTAAHLQVHTSAIRQQGIVKFCDDQQGKGGGWVGEEASQ